MADGIFTIFPDSSLVRGSAVKDGLRPSQKKALRDVQNTLQSHPNFVTPAFNPNLKSSNLAPMKHKVSDPPAEAQSFNIFHDNSSDQFWDPCDCDPDDGYICLRSANESLTDTDISYLMRGFTEIPQLEYSHDSYCIDLDKELFVINNYHLEDMLPTLPFEFLPYPVDPPLLIDVEDE